jgi:hypothetical protein
MSKITAFADSVGRIIVGEVVKSTKPTVMSVKEPAVVNVQVNQENGQISVQLLPFIFREFIDEKVREEGAVWDFPKTACITSSNLKLDENIINQYKNIFKQPVGQASPAGNQSNQPPEEPEVIKLFDD